jgi:hypothetical protein
MGFYLLFIFIIRQRVTQIFYLVYANVPKLILQKGDPTINQRIPSNQDIDSSLKSCGLISCQSQVYPPIVFNVSICGTFVRKNLNQILTNLKLSWQSDAINGGLGNANTIQIVYVNQTEVVPDSV